MAESCIITQRNAHRWITAAVVLIAGIGFAPVTAQADTDEQTRNVTLKSGSDGSTQLKFEGTVKSVKGRYALDGSFSGSCLAGRNEYASGSIHWRLVDGREHVQEAFCHRRGDGSYDFQGHVSESEPDDGTPALAAWLCIKSSSQAEEDCRNPLEEVYALGNAKEVRASQEQDSIHSLERSLSDSINFIAFRGAVRKESGNVTLAGVLGAQSSSDSFCKEHDGITFRVKYLPGEKTGGDLLGCPGPGDEFFKYTKMTERIDATAVELSVCLEKADAEPRCTEPAKYDL
ncbi:hypothetical protein [Nocardia brasiliensis]|uniref:hypothetical protein n=1 Tax=Nocardia brasiliensis TaxID=37326 RepID=UPI0011DCB6D5|nr:hypothetical protein [Nocardia brasiliensis]